MGIREDVEAGLADAAKSVGGSSKMVSTLRKSTPDASKPEYDPALTTSDHPITSIQTSKARRDREGNTLPNNRRILLVSALSGIVPLPKDKVAVGVKPADVDDYTVWTSVLAVNPVSPIGEALMYKLELES